MSAPAIARPIDAGVARPIDSDTYRAVMRHLPTGVAAICSTDPVTGAQHGMIVGTFASLSMDPALVTFSVMHSSTSWPKIAASGRFSVSLLADGQQPVCKALSAKGEDKLSAVDWSASQWGAPRIDGALAWFDCALGHELPGGDHLIVIANVLEMAPGSGAPLIFHGGRFGSFKEN
ncbi:monooxygenase [Sinomonas cyclohexanicum]|uniref:Monooxygenase n=1 Tax=Sinomonas cyclohexanicum TaxID=322009 RepID=A0ABM7Q0Q8_SINCY|nr:flavin reductase family protein [Corynebacterium cyclohexanicum]BCT78160.1 monooxygenase [Corynebacterium cyclohexanicum]